MATLIENGYKIFTDKEGNPIEEGYIFIGEAGLNPISNPQTAYWDSALTIPATNIRTAGGYAMYNGSPGRLYVSDNYSILVQNKQLQTVYVQLNAEGYVDTPSTVPGFDRTYVEVKSAATITIKEGSYADVNGTSVEILTDTDLQVTNADTDYYISLTDTGTVSMVTDSGTFDTDLNARYLAGARILKWVIRRDAAEVTLKTMYDTYNNSKVFPMEQSVNPTDYPVFANAIIYDYVIDSDVKLNALIGLTGVTYTNILVKAGTWTFSASTTLYLDDIGCKKLVGEPGAIIDGPSSYVAIAYRTIPTDIYAYLIYGIKFAQLGSDVYNKLVNVWFCEFSGYVRYCAYFHSCKLEAIYDTHHVENCIVRVEIWTCNYVTNCVSGKFYACTNLTNCNSTVVSASGSGSSYATPFNLCKYLVNCSVSFSSAGQEVRAFHTCEWCSNCSATIGTGPTVSSAVFYNSGFVYAPDVTGKGAATAFSGSTGVKTDTAL